MNYQPITAAAADHIPLPKCFFVLEACLNSLQQGLEINDPKYLLDLNVRDAQAAAAACVREYAKSPEQREAEEGLDLCGYAGKWQHAQEYVAAHEAEQDTPGYWQAVRTCFLELGGGLLSQRCTCGPAANTPTRQPLVTLPPVILGYVPGVRQG